MSNSHLARGVSILGAGYTALGDVRSTPEIKDLTEREMFAQASIEAMENGGVQARDIDAFYVGMSGPNSTAKIKSAGPQFADWVGLHLKPGLFHDEACATAGFGLNQAVMAVASGVYDVVLSGAVNINSTAPRAGYPPHLRGQLDPEARMDTVYMGMDPAVEKPGSGGAGAVEAILMRYAHQYGLSFDQVDEMLVNYLIAQREVALKNPKAAMVTAPYQAEAEHFGFNDVHDYLFSDRYNPKIGTLIRGRFLGAVVDGASAVVVCSTDIARKYVDHPIEVAGISAASALMHTFMNVPAPADLAMFKQAYAMAGITDPAREIDWMGIHDCPATMIAPVSEAAGYIPEGRAWTYMRDGKLGPDGPRPIDTDGGRTQTGHPGSPAFGVEIAELVSQMRGEAGERQMADPPRAGAIWGGGTGFNLATAVLRA